MTKFGKALSQSVAGVFALGLGFAGAAGYAASLPDFTELVKDYGDAVVNISTTQKTAKSAPGVEVPDLPEGHPFDELFKRFFGDGENPQQREAESLGSGFIISNDGYVLSNQHVVENAEKIFVRLKDRRVLSAEVVGTDARSDLALLKVEANDLPVVRVGNSNKLEVGEWVLAIGSPFGFEQSVTAGIVSAKGRSLPRENYVPFIQTDVAINPGNSGGPLFNMDGEVVGINSQIYSRTGGYMGLSFAIPIDMAMNVVDQLKSKGIVSRGWLGIVINEVNRELAEAFEMDRPRGALVAKIFPDSPADKAGFEVGDVVVSFNGQDVETSASLPPMVGSTGVGSTVTVEVLRKTEERSLQVRIEELPENDVIATLGRDTSSGEAAGITLTDLSEEERKALDLDYGIKVTAVSAGGAGEAAGLRPGDVVLELNHIEVNDIETFRTIVSDLPKGKAVPIRIHRDNSVAFLALKLPD
jgi:serine protease Do